MTKVLEEDLNDFISLSIIEEISEEELEAQIAKFEEQQLDAYDIEEDFNY